MRQRPDIDNISSTYIKPLEYNEKDFSYWIRTVEQSERSINIIWYVVIGLVVFMIISFITTIFILLNDNVRNKDLYLKYDNLYEDYSEKNSDMRDITASQQIEINNLRHEIELLRVKNPYLK